MDRKGSKGTGGSHLVVIDGSLPDARQTLVPPHLAEVSWIDHEEMVALSALADLKSELKPLKRKISANRVHSARVALRRWFSIWHVLRRDGWESGQFRRTIGQVLRKLQKLLGELRDMDVNIEQGERLGVSDELLQKWLARRKKEQRRLEALIAGSDYGKLTKKLDIYLHKRAPKIRKKLPLAKVELCAFDHIELFLLNQESVAREQAETARTPDEFHQLRLTVKRWRYLLTEFFGVTNLALVRAQQLLGQLHDLDRLTPILLHAETEIKALDNLKAKRKELLREIEAMRTQLPYGLRPAITSIKSRSGTRSRR